MLSARETVIQMVKDRKPETYVEVGCWKGELLRQIKPLVKKAVGIDPHRLELNEFGEYHCTMGSPVPIPQDELDEIAQECAREFGTSFLRTTSLKAAQKFEDGSLDFVFIDAIHDYDHVKEDIQAWLPKVKKGGMLCGDDYKPKRFNGLCKGVQEVLPDFTLNGVVWCYEV